MSVIETRLQNTFVIFDNKCRNCGNLCIPELENAEQVGIKLSDILEVGIPVCEMCSTDFEWSEKVLINE